MQQTDQSTACPFYSDVVHRLTDAGVPYVVGGAYAFAHYTGIHRGTKDLDLMLKRADVERALSVLAEGGHRGEVTFPHWLAKVYQRGSGRESEEFIDLIFSSGNGVAAVDDELLEHAGEVWMFGVPVKLCPVEEMIWTKAFVMERERYDGADVAHLIHVQGRALNWERLLQRFGAHWRLLLAHVVLVGYIYPHERSAVPLWVMRELLGRFAREISGRASGTPVCAGTLVSREQFLVDVHHWGYVDGRLAAGAMSEDEIEAWTQAIGRP